MSTVFQSTGHNLDQLDTRISFDNATLTMMAARAGLNQPLIQSGDSIGLILKSTPGPGTATGAGGYLTFYIPPGTQVENAEYGRPTETGAFAVLPMKGPAIMAIGDGSVGSATTAGLVGLTLGPNAAGVTAAAVSGTGVHNGTLAGVYGDVGIFYATDPDTVWQSFVGSGGYDGNSGTSDNILTNNRGEARVPITKWDAEQLIAFGLSSPASPLLDPNGRGNSPWGMASAVAGPQSGYQWAFDRDYYLGNPGDPSRLRNSIVTGPWKRIQFPGSTIAQDQVGLKSTTLGFATADASSLGTTVTPGSPLPPTLNWTDGTSPKAVRISYGGLVLGQPEYARIQLKILADPGQPNSPFDGEGCLFLNSDAFGGDAGGEQGGKDHLWRYYDPTTQTVNPCALLQKHFAKSPLAPGATSYFEMEVINTGTSAMNNVVVTDPMPSGLSYLSATPAPNSTSPLTWNLGTVPAQGYAKIRVNFIATGSGTLFNTASMTSSAGSTTAMDSVDIGIRSILDPTKSVNPSNASPGATVTYTIAINNIGTGANGTPLVLTDILPVGFTYGGFVSAQINGAAAASGVVTASGADPTKPKFTITQGIQPGKSLVIIMTAVISGTQASGVYGNAVSMNYEGKIVTSGSLAPVTVGGGKIGETIFRDWNGNGSQDVGELGMQGVTVTLYRDADNNGSFETLVGNIVTDASGNYLFTGLAAGSYQVSVPAAGSGGVPTGYTLTADPNGAPISSTFNVSLTANQSVLTADFGYRPAGTGTIGDQVLEDTNKNGTWNAGEPGIPNVTVRLYADNNNSGTIDAGDLLVSTTTTNGSGVYGFSSLDTTRRYLAQVDTSDSDIAAYFNGLYGSGANQLTSTNPFVVNSGFTAITTADFGFWRALPASIGDQVFVDNNLNGTYDAGDSPLGNITVNLFAADGVTLVATTTTDVSGMYLFNSVAAGTYVVRVDPADTDIPSGFSTSVFSFNPTLAAGASFLTADFPFISVFNKSVDRDAATAGELLTYTMSPYWPGPSLLTNASVSDTVPDGTTFVSAGQGGALSGLTGSAAVNGSVAAVAASSGSPVLTSVADNEIWSDQPTTNYGTLDEMWIERTNSYRNRLLIRFDLSTIPSNATISSAVMRLTKESGNNGNPNIAAHRLNVAWDETTSSWNNSLTATPWSAAGAEGNYHSTAEATTSVTSNGNYNWALNSLTQAWVNNSIANNGVIMRLPDEVTNGEHRFYTREHATATNHPRLTVNWSVAAVTGTTTAITVTPSSVTDAGSGVNVNVSMTVTATAAVTNIIPSALTVIPGANGATATLVSSPTNSPASIGAGGGSATFTWVYRVFKGTAEDQVRFAGNATGTGATFASATSNGVVVKDAAASSTAVWNLGSNSAAVDGSQASTPGSGTVNAPAAADSWLDGNSTSTNYGSATTMQLDSGGGNQGNGRPVMRFDLSGIPSGATITGATLRLQATAVGAATSRTIRLYPLTAAFVENQVTWNIRSTGNNWSPAGGSFGSELANTAVAGTGAYSWTSASLATQVQTWFDTPANNFGLLLGDTDGVGVTKDFATKENGNSAFRPVLEISYTGGPGSPATTTAMSVLPALVTDTGSGVNVTVTQTVTATGAVTNITPPTNLTVAGISGASATRISGPTGSGANIGAGGGSATFTWVYRVTAGSTPGQVTFAGTPTGTGATFAVATSNGIIVTPPLTMQVQVISPTPGVPLVNNIAQFYNGPTFLAEDNAITSLTGSIGDFVWQDTDGDGVQEVGEPGLSGVRVFIDQNANGSYDSGEPNDITDGTGAYRIFGLTAGTYAVALDLSTLPVGYSSSTPSTLSAVLALSSTQYSNADFGLRPPPAVSSSIGDTLWIDANENGAVDTSETLLANITIRLYRDNNNNGAIDAGDIPLGITSTNASGQYLFSSLYSGDYLVDVLEADPDVPAGLELVSGGANGLGLHDVTLGTGVNYLTADFGYNYAGSIGDFIFRDDDGNGVWDSGEAAVGGVTMLLYRDDGDGSYNPSLDTPAGFTETDINGNYLFDNLPPGNYWVKADESTVKNAAGEVGKMVGTAGTKRFVMLAANQDYPDADMGFIEGAEVEGHVFHDINSNGQLDSGETRLPNVLVTLTGTTIGGDAITRTVLTDASGEYGFIVPPGTYTVSYDTADPDIPAALTTRTTPISFQFSIAAGVELGHLDFGLDNTGSIGDTIFANANGNSTQDSGEAGLANVVVNLYTDPARTILLDSDVTDANGRYLFAGLADGTYYTQVDTSTLPGGYNTMPTADPDASRDSLGTVLVTAGGGILTQDFGYTAVAPTFAVSGTVFDDLNTGGTPNIPGEELAGVTVTAVVTTGGNTQTFTTGTDGNGLYTFGGIPSGSNVVVTLDPATLGSPAYVQTVDPDPTVNHSTSISNVTANVTGKNFGYVEQRGSIAGTVVKGNGNGLAEGGEPVQNGVLVTLVYAGPDGVEGNGDDQIFTQNTVGGNFTFTNLLPGNYNLRTTIPSGLQALADRDGANPNSIDLALGVGQDKVDQDFEYQAGSIGDYVWNDANGDGLQEASELPLPGVRVYVDSDGDNTYDLGEPSGTTNASGLYVINGLAAGTHSIRVDTTTLPAGVSPTYDLDGIGSPHEASVTLAINEDRDDADFGYQGNASIGDYVWSDADGDGVQDSGEFPLPNVIVYLDLDEDSILDPNEPRATTDGGGHYTLGGLIPGTYTVTVAPSTLPSAATQTGDPDVTLDGKTSVLLVDGQNVTTADFGYQAPVFEISGQVRDDLDADGDFSDPDRPVNGVTVRLFADGNGNGIAEPGEWMATTVTDSNGNYVFRNLIDGDYLVVETDLQDSTSTADTDAPNDNLIAVTLAGGDSTGNDFLDEVDPAGYFYASLTGRLIPGGSVSVSGPGAVTVLQDGTNGQYAFTVDAAGTYTLAVTPPPGWMIDPGRPVAGASYDVPAGPGTVSLGSPETTPGYLGDPSAVANPYYLTFILEPGDQLVLNNNLPLIIDKPSTWNTWQAANAGSLGTQTAPGDNRDGDLYENLLEFALCLDPGTGTPLLVSDPTKRGGFCVDAGTGTMDAFFTRPLGGISEVTYTLEVSAALGNPTLWTDVTSLTPNVTSNGDGSETVRYVDLEQIDGTSAEGVNLSGGLGFARLRVDLDDGVTTATSHTEVFGWSVRAAQAECETCSDPFVPKEVFSGTVDSSGGAGNVLLDLTTSAGAVSIAEQIGTRPNYVEILDGTYEGHRFEVASASATGLTLQAGAARNTLAPIPDLGGALLALRAHRVLDDVVSAADFVDTVTPTNNNDPATAGRVLFFDNVNGWATYFAYDAAGTIAPYWTSADNSFLENVGDSVLANGNDERVVIGPCAAFYTHPKAHAIEVLMVGVVRDWDFACPLDAGYNFVGSGYPLVQSPNDRNMSLSYFTGTSDPATADQIEFWLADGPTFGIMAYESHFRVLSGVTYDYWTTQENSSLPNENTSPLFGIQRGAFIRSVLGNDRSNPSKVWLWPVPWTP